MRPLRCALVAVLSSCAPSAPRAVVAPPTPPKVEPAAEHPARWVLLPRPWTARAHVDLDGGRTLWVGDFGERWLLTPSKLAEGAPELLPEDIDSVVALSDQRFALVGRSGQVYHTDGPLGPVREVLPPPHAFRRVSAGSAGFVAITTDERLLRSTDGGSTWKQVMVPGDAVGYRDIALAGSQGLLLGMPQRLFHTKDGGATFLPIPLGGGSPIFLQVSVQGEVVLHGEAARKLVGNALVAATGVVDQPKVPGTIGHDARWAFSGTHLFAIDDEGKEGAHAWTLSTQRLVDKPKQAVPERSVHLLDTLSQCDRVTLGALDDLVEFACETTIDAGDVPTRSVRFYRSTDAGQTLVEDGVLPDTKAHAPVVGPQGYLLVPADCEVPPEGLKGEFPECRAHERKSAGSPFTEPKQPTPLVAVLDRARKQLFSLSWTKDGAVLERRTFDGSVQTVAKLPGVTFWPLLGATLDVDGSRVLIGVPYTTHLDLLRSTDAGVTFVRQQLPKMSRFAARGRRLLASGSGRLLESDDDGVTFTPVQSPGAWVLGCNDFACATTRGLRIGFDLPGPPPPTPVVAEPVPPKRWATPLRCSTTSPWKVLGLGELPSLEAIDPTPDLRLAWPRRGADGSVSLVLVDRAGKSTTLPLLGPEPTGPLDRSRTEVRVQSAGVVAARYQYQHKETSVPGLLSPVDAHLAFVPWATGKVQKVSLPKVGTWRVAHDPQSPLSTTLPFPYPGETLAIEGQGLWFRPRTTNTARFLREGKAPELLDTGEFASVLFRTTDRTYLLPYMGMTQFSSRKPGKGWTPHDWTLWPVHEGAEWDTPLYLDGKPHIATFFPGNVQAPAAHFAVALADTADPGPTIALPLPTDPPRLCLDTKGTRMRGWAPYGLRHPVYVTDDEGSMVLATDAVVLRGASTSACEAAWLAVPPRVGDNAGDVVAILRPDELGVATVYRADRSSWPNEISSRTLSCVWEPGGLHPDLLGQPRF